MTAGQARPVDPLAFELAMELVAAVPDREQLRALIAGAAAPRGKAARAPVWFRSATEVLEAHRDRVITKEEARKALGYPTRTPRRRALSGAAAAAVARRRGEGGGGGP